MPQPTRFVIRTYHRIPVRCLLYYMGGEFLGKGTVLNMSRNGMRVLGDHSLTPGTDVSVRLLVEEHGPPIEVSRASVRWVTQYEFGLKIDQLSQTAAHRIAGLVKAHASASRNESR